MNKLTWDNPVLMGPAMAERMGIKTEDLVELELNGKKVTAPVWIQVGHPDNSVTVFLGYGRRRAGRVGTGAGFDMYPLRTSATPWFTSGVSNHAKPEAITSWLPPRATRPWTRRPARDPWCAPRIWRSTARNPNFAQEEEPPKELTLYKPYPYAAEPYAWGMTIDMNACVGCNNCIVACQSENNIPVVGKEQTVAGPAHALAARRFLLPGRPRQSQGLFPASALPAVRERSLRGGLSGGRDGAQQRRPERHGVQPLRGHALLFRQLSLQSRRFNFLLFQDWETSQYKMMRNPDVTVRSRGVMEKCTYCVQRINQHRIDSERDDRKIQDGELQTACQQSCPANAIVFGNINDPNSRVSKLKAQPRNYSLLGDLNTRPRTTYLADIRNPNPELEAGERHAHGAQARSWQTQSKTSAPRSSNPATPWARSRTRSARSC